MHFNLLKDPPSENKQALSLGPLSSLPSSVTEHFENILRLLSLFSPFLLTPRHLNPVLSLLPQSALPEMTVPI